MAYPILPEEAQIQFDDVARKYAVFIHTQQYPEALSIIKDLYNKMLDWQQKYGQRFHKGYPIHNIGYTFHLQANHEEALKYFILAYVEDLLSADRLEEADATPAGQTLLLGYKYSPELLELLKRKVSGLKKQDGIPLQPEEVVQELGKSKTGYQDIKGKIEVQVKEHRLRKFTIFDSEWETRVFMGGSGDAIINKMRDIVDKIGGYDPVVVVDFNMPNDMTIYNKCLTLLHSCKYAIFDLSMSGGQIVEIERAPDYGIKTLAVCQADKEHFITQVLKSCLEDRRIEYKSYTDFSELENLFCGFLKGQSKRGEAPLS